MKEVRYGNRVLTYDDTIQVGDIITAYRKGWHRVVKVTERPNSTSYIEYQMVMYADGRLSKGKATMGCDGSYCKKWDEEQIDQYLKDQVNFCTEISDKLKVLLKGNKE